MTRRNHRQKPKPLLREVAYQRFRKHLFRRDLVPGQFASQSELCALLDVPLGPLREALKRLEAEGLVRLIPQRGIQVAEIGVSLIRDAFQFRAILEVAAVRHFVSIVDDATIVDLERMTMELLKRLKADKGGDPRLADAVDQLDFGLHDMIVESLGNRIVTAAHRANFDKIRLIGLHAAAPRNPLLALEEHLAVIAAMKSRDPEGAAAALGQHLRSAEQRALGR